MAFLAGTYDPLLVVLSISIALIASYTALDLVSRIRAAEGRTVWGWLVAGAVSMGSGIWAMHFVGMLAFDLPIPMGYRIDLTVASWVAAVLGSLIALRLSSGATLPWPRYLAGTLCMSAAIVSMHYIGMAAMDMQPGISYDPLWAAASIAIALFACAAGLQAGFKLRHRERFFDKAAGAVAFGCAIAGMHYAAMHAAQFPLGSVCGAATVIDNQWLAFLTTNTAWLLLACTLTASALGRRMESRTSQYVASLETANIKLHHANRHDSLTNLGNRVLLREQLDVAIRDAARAGRRFALISLDLDGFKQFNDNLGHDRGDEILCQVGDVLRQAVRAQDTAVRLGGDKFALLVLSAEGNETLNSVCERVLTAVRSVGAGTTHLTATLGVACYPADGRTSSALLKTVDIAMYSAKNAGKDRYAFFAPELTEGLEREFVVRNELALALRNGDIRPYYQPKYDVKTRRIVGSEALARWHHPSMGMVSPGQFIGVAERSNQIGELQIAMLRQVCADIKAWRSQGILVPPVAFNLSAMCLRNRNLPQVILGTLTEFGLSCKDLICEITETSAIPELSHTLEILHCLRAQGVQIALDDFGTGLSSMSYLRDLPVDQLKIDRAFIKGLISHNEHEAMIVHAMIDLAHVLNLSVVAEGVEDESQLAKLRQMRCDQVQGFLFSPAVPRADFALLLQRHESRKIVQLRTHKDAG